MSFKASLSSSAKWVVVDDKPDILAQKNSKVSTYSLSLTFSGWKCHIVDVDNERARKAIKIWIFDVHATFIELNRLFWRA